jgi:hypothetical protein
MPNFAKSQQRPHIPPPDYDEEPAPDYDREMQSYLLAFDLESAQLFVGEALKRRRNRRPPWTLLLPTEEDVARCMPMLAKEQREWARRFDSPIPNPTDDLLQVRAYEGTGILGALNPRNSTLYIEAHGAPGGGRLSAKVHGSWIDRPVKEIAQELRKHGLRGDFRDIRLLACRSGNPGPDGGPSTAEQLCHHMRDVGFANVDVAGYLGSVECEPRFDDNDRMYSAVNEGGLNVQRRSKRQVRFSANPEAVRR